MSAVATDVQHAVEDAAAHLYVWALKDIPQDLRDALAAARDKETSVPGRRVLETIHRNISVADRHQSADGQQPGQYEWRHGKRRKPGSEQFAADHRPECGFAEFGSAFGHAATAAG